MSADPLAWLDTQVDQSALVGEPGRTITPPPDDVADRRALDLFRLMQERGNAASGLEIGAVFARGGMAQIRGAHQQSLTREVAVKQLRLDTRDRESMIELLREAWVLGALEHPNIVPVHDIGVDSDGQPLIVLKKIDGVSWTRLMADAAEVRARFGSRDLLEWNLGILLQVANAIRFAHSRGLLHRDIKPDNVMIGAFGEVYVVDWGIAVTLRDDASGRFPRAASQNYIAGTPMYMAPEMLGPGDQLSERTDIYLLGATLYHIAVGRPPHTGTCIHEVLRKVATVAPAFPGTVPPELVRICQRAMNLDPAARHASVDELQSDIREFLLHRASAVLSEHGAGRLDQLLAELAAEPDEAPSIERRQALYALYGQCRFGFREALESWPGNEQAARGLERAACAMAGYELAQGEPRAAASLVGELDSPPEALLAQIEAATAERDRRQRALESLGAEHDRSFRPRARVAVGVAWAIGWSAPTLVLGLVDPGSLEIWMLMATFLVSAVLTTAISMVGRRALFGAPFGRRVLGAVGWGFAVVLVELFAGWVAGIPPQVVCMIQLPVLGTAFGLMAVLVDRWYWPPAAGFLVAFVAAARWPSLTFQLYAATLFLGAASGVAQAMRASRQRATDRDTRSG